MGTLDTWYAPADRATIPERERQAAIMASSRFVQELLRTAGGLLAVLNEHRQLLVINDALLRHLGFEDAATTLGLRLGEALGCVHVDDAPWGCGTGRLCRSCGAAIAIVASLAGDDPVERDCALSRTTGGTDITDTFLRVRGVRTVVQGRPFVLLFLLDATREHRQAALERVFLHDVSNIAQGLLGSAEMLAEGVGPDDEELRRAVLNHAEWISDEIALHRTTCQVELGDFHLRTSDVEVAALLQRVRSAFIHHPLAAGKQLLLELPSSPASLSTGATVLRRVLANMITNALEAEASGATVRLGAQELDGVTRFVVHNPSAIPEPVQDRIFTRHFSTKGELGRGLGTYSMKLYGERILGGRVGFSSSEALGTRFWIELPQMNATG